MLDIQSNVNNNEKNYKFNHCRFSNIVNSSSNLMISNETKPFINDDFTNNNNNGEYFESYNNIENNKQHFSLINHRNLESINEQAHQTNYQRQNNNQRLHVSSTNNHIINNQFNNNQWHNHNQSVLNNQQATNFNFSTPRDEIFEFASNNLQLNNNDNNNLQHYSTNHYGANQNQNQASISLSSHQTASYYNQQTYHFSSRRHYSTSSYSLNEYHNQYNNYHPHIQTTSVNQLEHGNHHLHSYSYNCLTNGTQGDYYNQSAFVQQQQQQQQQQCGNCPTYADQSYNTQVLSSNSNQYQSHNNQVDQLKQEFTVRYQDAEEFIQTRQEQPINVEQARRIEYNSSTQPTIQVGEFGKLTADSKQTNYVDSASKFELKQLIDNHSSLHTNNNLTSNSDLRFSSTNNCCSKLSKTKSKRKTNEAHLSNCSKNIAISPLNSRLKSKLNDEQLQQYNIKSNKCNLCGRNYARPSTLKTHLRTHTNERPFSCSVCQKTFSQAANLTAHQRVHTGERPFACPICGRLFSQSSSVITHLRTHSGERPYRCNMCSRTFSDSSTLTKHCRIHSGEKPYQCSYCSLNFSQSGNLSRHLKLHLTSSSSTSSSLTSPPISTSKRGTN